MLFGWPVSNTALASVDRPVEVLESTTIKCRPSSESNSIANIKKGLILHICTQCENPQEIKDENGKIWKRIFWDSQNDEINNLTGWILKQYLRDLPY
jgi:hypothetical protein